MNVSDSSNNVRSSVFSLVYGWLYVNCEKHVKKRDLPVVWKDKKVKPFNECQVNKKNLKATVNRFFIFWSLRFHWLLKFYISSYGAQGCCISRKAKNVRPKEFPLTWLKRWNCWVKVKGLKGLDVYEKYKEEKGCLGSATEKRKKGRFFRPFFLAARRWRHLWRRHVSSPEPSIAGHLNLVARSICLLLRRMKKM